jgi:hypothetical protein
MSSTFGFPIRLAITTALALVFLITRSVLPLGTQFSSIYSLNASDNFMIVLSKNQNQNFDLQDATKYLTGHFTFGFSAHPAIDQIVLSDNLQAHLQKNGLLCGA